eukprot:GHVP01022121.1.p1 GENE.GHVP01022121.1~~GHVP01022121.1.p1  ORF type:complete len:1127 (+),score=185.21 GHVP01022121.1:42-3422(+)
MDDSMPDRWPAGVTINSVENEELKSKFCVIVKNKPPRWGAKTLAWYLHHYFQGQLAAQIGYLAPTISDIFVTDKFPTHVAVVACQEEQSRSRLLSVRYIAIPSSWIQAEGLEEASHPEEISLPSSVVQEFPETAVNSSICLEILPFGYSLLHEEDEPRYCENKLYMAPCFLNSLQQIHFKFRGPTAINQNQSKSTEYEESTFSKVMNKILNPSEATIQKSEIEYGTQWRRASLLRDGAPISVPMTIDGFIWPVGTRLSFVTEELKYKLCVHIDNKPVAWESGSLFRYLRDYFYQKLATEGQFPPIICDVSAYADKSSSIIALRDEISVARLLANPYIELPSTMNSDNPNAALASCMYIRPYSSGGKGIKKRPQTDNGPKSGSVVSFMDSSAELLGDSWLVENFSQLYQSYIRNVPAGHIYPSSNFVAWPTGKPVVQVHGSLQARLCVSLQGVPLHWDENGLLNHLGVAFYVLQQEIGFICPNLSAVYIFGDGEAVVACSDEISRQRFLSLRIIYMHTDWGKGKLNNAFPSQYSAISNSTYVPCSSDHLLVLPYRPSDASWKLNIDMPLVKTDVTWPCDLVLKDVKDSNLKKRLCCCFKNKPTEWGTTEIKTFVIEYCRYSGIPVPTFTHCCVVSSNTLFACFTNSFARNLVMKLGHFLLPLKYTLSVSEASSAKQLHLLTAWTWTAKLDRSSASAAITGDMTDAFRSSISKEARPTEITWPSGAFLRDVVDLATRCRLCAFVLNKPIGWDGDQVRKAIIRHHAQKYEIDEESAKEKVKEEIKMEFIAANPSAAYALVVCSDELSKDCLLSRRVIHFSILEKEDSTVKSTIENVDENKTAEEESTVAPEEQTIKFRQSNKYMEVLPLTRDTNWNEIRTKFGPDQDSDEKFCDLSLWSPPEKEEPVVSHEVPSQVCNWTEMARGLGSEEPAIQSLGGLQVEAALQQQPYGMVGYRPGFGQEQVAASGDLSHNFHPVGDSAGFAPSVEAQSGFSISEDELKSRRKLANQASSESTLSSILAAAQAHKSNVSDTQLLQHQPKSQQPDVCVPDVPEESSYHSAHYAALSESIREINSQAPKASVLEEEENRSESPRLNNRRRHRDYSRERDSRPYRHRRSRSPGRSRRRRD